MSANQSPHHPLLAGSELLLTGKVEIDTGLRELQSYQVSFVSAQSADTAHVHATARVDGYSVKLTIEVLDATYVTATHPATVSWIALGK